MLTSMRGIKCGEMRRCPRSRSTSAAVTMSCSDPMPEPIATPVRCRSDGVCGLHPAASSASPAAASAKWMNGDMLRSSPGASSRCFAMSNSASPSPLGTIAATSEGNPCSA
eukprot:6095423-Prymnesium_polylepis.1